MAQFSNWSIPDKIIVIEAYKLLRDKMMMNRKDLLKLNRINELITYLEEDEDIKQTKEKPCYHKS